MTFNATMSIPKRKQTMGQVTETNKLKSKSAMNTPTSSGPPSPKKHSSTRLYTHTPKSKSLTLRTSPKRDINSEDRSLEFLLSPDDKDTATESIASDQTNPEESDPNSVSVTSPTQISQSFENHESIEQAIKTLEEKIKLDQHEHAIRILSRQAQQPEYKDENQDPSSPAVTAKKSGRANTVAISKSIERRPILQPKSYSYSSPQRSLPIQPINNESQRKPSVPSVKPKNLCTCGDPDSFWCQVCENRRFKSAFLKWGSGNKIIDNYIQETQLNTAGPFNYLEWISFDRFRNIKSFSEGGYGTLSTATWLDGPRSLRDDKVQTKWKRDARKRVILKFLHNSEHISQEFFREFVAYYKRISWDNCMLQYYGISQDPSTKNHVIVMEYTEHGNIRKYLSENVENTSWKLKLALACDIAKALKTIHRANLIHRNFHCGNIMITNDVYTAMGDLGLCQPIDNKPEEGQVYGVLPYLAPEVIKKQKFSKASDIYSFAFVMWEISSGMKPFGDRAHNHELALELCMGSRPKPVEGTPPCYTALMEQCWDPDPSKRPNADFLHRTLYDWAKKVIETPKLPYKVNTEFAVAEQWRLRLRQTHSQELHSEAKYTSQLFDFHDLDIPDMEETVCEPEDVKEMDQQSNLSQSPSVESVYSKNTDEKCESPDEQLVDSAISHKTLPNENRMEIEF